MTLCPVFVLIFFVLYSIITQVFLLRKMVNLFLNIDKKPTTKDFIPFRPLHSGLNSKSTSRYTNQIDLLKSNLSIGVNNLKLILFLTATSALWRPEQPHNPVVFFSWASHLPLFQIFHESFIHQTVLEQPLVSPGHLLGRIWAVSYEAVAHNKFVHLRLETILVFFLHFFISFRIFFLV